MPVDSTVIPILIPLGAFIMVVIIVWVASQEKQAKARYRAEVQKELIAKFGSGRELTEFLNSEGSQRLLGTLQGSDEGSSQDPRRKTIGLITGGLINLSIGAGLLAFVSFWREGVVPGLQWSLMLAGWLTTGLGASLLIVAAVSYHLAKKWGLDKPGGAEPHRSDLPKNL
jgi:hypothetical protein